MYGPSWLQVFDWLRDDGMKIAQSLMEDSQTVAAMRAEKFDLVLRDIGSWPTHLPSELLNIPEVDFMPVGSFMPWAGPRYNIPDPIAYLPQFTSSMLPSPVILHSSRFSL